MWLAPNMAPFVIICLSACQALFQFNSDLRQTSWRRCREWEPRQGAKAPEEAYICPRPCHPPPPPWVGYPPLFLFWAGSYVDIAWVLSTFTYAVKAQERYRVILYRRHTDWLLAVSKKVCSCQGRRSSWSNLDASAPLQVVAELWHAMAMMMMTSTLSMQMNGINMTLMQWDKHPNNLKSIWYSRWSQR